MTSAALPAALSTLLAPVVDGPSRACMVIGMTSVSWHVHLLETDLAEHEPDISLISVQLPVAERLPCSLVVDSRPQLHLGDRGWIGNRRARFNAVEISTARWFRPARPRIVAPSKFLAACWDLPKVDLDDVGLGGCTVIRPSHLLGRGPGLTPAGDDVLAAALVVGHALGVSTPGWPPPQLAKATTPLSAELLRSAARGYCCDRLASLVQALDRGEDPSAAIQRLLALGGTTGRAMLLGLRYAANQLARRMVA
jgi:hypothetical protein